MPNTKSTNTENRSGGLGLLLAAATAIACQRYHFLETGHPYAAPVSGLPVSLNVVQLGASLAAFLLPDLLGHAGSLPIIASFTGFFWRLFATPNTLDGVSADVKAIRSKVGA